MGLDMYIYREGEELQHRASYEEYSLWKSRNQLCYWRKHPNLHGFIVNTFADGVDECQRIPLTAKDVRKILKASREGKLPHTEGFFFGQSYSEHDKETELQLTGLLGMLKADSTMKIYYQASW